MNRIFRLVFSASVAQLVPIAENAGAARSRSVRSRSAAATSGAMAWTLLATAAGMPGFVQAAPTGAQVTAGSGNVSQKGGTTTVSQSSENLSLNWQSFNVATNEVVNFVQPDAAAIAVNRILSNTGSQILGHLNANGQVWLINANGILFGKGAQVNVGGLSASTLDVNDAALGASVRSIGGSGTGSIVNEGTITAADGGYVALTGNQVSNQGTITARLGTVALGAGSAATLTFDGRQLIHLKVDQSTLNSLAENKQLIQADGGNVIMTAGAQDTLLASAVNNTGIVQARSVENHHGTITLLAGMRAGEVSIGGTLDASGPASTSAPAPAGGASYAHGTGGSIETSGASVAIAHDAKVVAGQGGSWLIDPTDLTIDGAAATAIDASLNAGTSVTELTTATGVSGSGTQTAGAGDINVNAAIAWTNPAATLTLTAYNAINVNAPVTGAGAVVMQAGTGNLTLASGSSIEGDAGVTLGTGANFVNNAGVGALSAGTAGRWLVYSTDPLLDTVAGLAPNFIQYAAAFQTAAAQTTGNGLLYRAAPSITVTALTGTASKIYDGGTAANLTQANSNYIASGLLNGDTLVAMSGTYQSADAGSNLRVTSATTAAGLTVSTAGGAIPVYGYALAGNPVSAAIGTITPAALSASIVGNPTKVYDGTTTATLTTANYGLTGFVSGESATVNQPSSVAYASATAGPEIVNATFSHTNFVAGSGTTLANYTLPTSASGAGTVLQAPLVVTGVLATSKVYDATTGDVLDTSHIGMYGVIGADSVSLSTAGAAGVFASSNAGNNIGVTATGFTLSGSQAQDYRVVDPSGLKAGITRATLTVSGVVATNKVYDGNATDLLNTSNAALSGIIGSDAGTVNFSTVTAAGAFVARNVGSALSVTVTGLSVSGSGASNYNLVQPSGLTANITPAPLTATLIGIPTKPYNGTTTADLGAANFTLSGFVAGEGASIPQTALAAYDSPNAGARTVTVTLAAPDFAPTGATLMSNYSVPATVVGSGTITPAPLTGAIVGNPSKVYDGTGSAALAGSNYSLSGFLTGEGATVTQTSGTYASANAGLWQVSAALSSGNYSVTGTTLLSNYSLPTLVLGTGTITQAPLVGYVYAGITGNPTKPYDGTTTANLGSANFVLSGFTGGQGADVTQTVGQYSSANAGPQTISASLSAADFSAHTGTDLANYHLPAAAYGTGTISPVALTVTITGDPTRVYNGSTSMVLASSNYSISGFVSGQGATINPSSLVNYASANAGAENLTAALTPSAYFTVGGTLLSNYVLAPAASGVGHISQAPVYVTGVYATNKVYDTTNVDPLNSGAVALTGVVGADTGNLTLAGTATGSFNTIHAGNALPVVVGGYSLTGSAASNYVLQPIPSLTANITPAPLTVSGVTANSKPYDGTNAATLDTSAEALNGVYAGDTVTLSSVAAVSTFGSVNVGTHLTVSAGGFLIAGAQSSDYAVRQPSGLTADITPAPITALVTGNPTKVYDGSASTTLTAANYTLQGFATGEGALVPQSASANYVTPDAGTGVGINSTLVLSDFIANSGTNLSNYQLPTTGTGTGTITRAPLIASLIGNPTKVYDTTAAATLASANYRLSGFVGSQTAVVTQTSGTYASANAGGQSVTATLAQGDYSVSGNTNLNNYALPVSATGTGTVTRAPLTVSATTTAQVYNGTTIDALTGVTLSGTIYGGDAPVLATGSYETGNLGNSGNAGTDTVTTNIGLNGTRSGNYTVIQPTGLTAVISPAQLTATSIVNRTYDGTSTASLSGGNTVFSGFVAGQGATVNTGVTGTFASPNAGAGIGISGVSLTAGDVTATGGTLLSNYALPLSDNGTGSITAASLTYTAALSSQQYGLTPSGLSGSVGGFVNGETVGSATTGSAAFSTAASAASNVGHYNIDGSGLTANNGNYVFVQAAGNATALTVTPAPLSVVNVATTSRLYNGSTADALSGATLSGTVYNLDTPTLTNAATGTLVTTGTATPNANVGTHDVTTAMGLSGTGSGNYTLLQPTGLTAVISALGLTATSTATRAYNGTNVASLSGANTAFSGFVAGQGATVKSGVTGTFATANVGSGIVVTGGALTLANLTAIGGTNLANYVLPTSDNGTGSITPAIVNLTSTRVYDAATDANAGIFGTNGTVNGVAGENLVLSGSGTLASKNVGARTVSNLGSLTLSDGTGSASNYTLIGGTDSVTVTKLAITVTGTGANKVYDGSVNDAVTLTSTGILAGDTATFAKTLAVFGDKNVGTAKTVSISGISAGGTDGGNYSVNATATSSADVTPLGITVTGTGVNKVYDAGVNDAATLASAGVVSGDTVSFADTSAVFADKNVANGKTVSIAGITDSGVDAGNYTLNNTSATTSANITRLAITVSAGGGSRVYDGTRTAAVTLASLGVLSGDSVGFTSTSALFADKSAVNGKTVSIAGISATGTDAGNYSVNTTATVIANISRLGITVTGTGVNKVYNGNLNDAVTLASAGVVSGDTVTFAKTAAVFGDKNVGTAKTVSISGITKGGTDSANYNLNNTTASTTANITPLGITVTGTGANKVYDGGVNDAATLASAGVVSGDNLTFTDTSAVFGDKNVANGKTVTISGISKSGTDAANYTLNNVTASTSANITPLGITVTGTGANKVYDGGVSDVATLASAGILSGDTVSFADISAVFGDKNVANGKTVTISGISKSGTDAANYTLSNVTASTTANITPLGITVTGTGVNKVYDGNVGDAATLASAGIISGDTVSFADTSAVFGDKNVGNGKTVTISGISKSGTDSANYTLNNLTASSNANITPLGITVAGTGVNKVYDGGVGDVATLASAGIISGDTVSFADTSAVFGDKNVGTVKTVSIAGITKSGTDAANYTLNNVTTSTTANITPLGITVAGTGVNKVYDGNVGDAATLASAGILSGDTVSFGDTSAVFGDKNVANGKTVTISGISKSGTDAANYTLNNVTASTNADITPLGITVTGTGANKVYDGGVNDAATLASAGILSGDTVSFGDTSAVFGDKNVANGKTVTISGISKSGTDAANYTLSNVTASTTANITPLGITVTGTGANKVYDGGVNDAATMASAGIISGDTVSFADTSAVFGDKNVGTAKAVSIGGISKSGTDAANYTLNNVTASTTADITPLGITVAGTGVNKVYDGNVGDAATLASAGIISGDTVSFADTSAVFGDKNVANGQTVTISGISKSGTDAANYTLNNVTASTTADITPLGITVAGTAANKTYDGTTAATVTTLAGAGIVSGDTVSFADTSAVFGDKNVGTAKAVSISGISKSGIDAANYTLNNVTASTNADITPLGITVTGTGANKVYDGGVNDAATLASAGIISGDTVSFGDTSAVFGDKNVGTAKTVSIGGISKSGADAANYTLNNVTASTTADITPLGITVAGTAANKTYDGTPAATVTTLGSASVVSGDIVTFDDAGAAFADKNAGAAKPVTISGITVGGADGGNYAVAATTMTIADITPLAITVTGSGTNRVYDGTRADAVTLASTGVLAGDEVTFADAAATFADKNVGSAKTVLISGIAAAGADANNYAANTTADTVADISPATLTETATQIRMTTGTLPVLSGTVSGFVAGDTAANATVGVLVWLTDAPAHPAAGMYAIDGSGMSAPNYVIVQAAGNVDALSVKADSGGVAQLVYGLLGVPLSPQTIATPYGVGSDDDQGNNTGNARRDPNPTNGNRHLTDFTGRLALTVVDGGVRTAGEVAK